MLCAPNSGHTVDHDLALQDAVDTTPDGSLRGGTTIVTKKSEVVFSRCVAEKLQQSHHAAVVERDVTMVSLAERVELRPTAMGILSLENVIETPA